MAIIDYEDMMYAIIKAGLKPDAPPKPDAFGMPNDCLLCHNFESFTRWLLTNMVIDPNNDAKIYGTSPAEASIRGIGHLSTLRGVSIIVDEYVPKGCVVLMKDGKIVGVIKYIEDKNDAAV